MTATSDAKSLELTVTNFGPIAEGKIELRPMTVFVGPSNTGKSYMAALIYALHRFFGGYSRKIDYLRFKGEPFGSFESMPPEEFDLQESDFEDLSNWFSEVLPQGDKGEQLANSSLELPEAIADLVRPLLSNVAHLNEDLDSELARCFGVEKAKNLVRYPSNGATGFSLRGRASTVAGSFHKFGYKVTVTENGAELDASISQTMPMLVRHQITDRHFPWRWMANELSMNDERRSDIASLD